MCPVGTGQSDQVNVLPHVVFLVLTFCTEARRKTLSLRKKHVDTGRLLSLLLDTHFNVGPYSRSLLFVCSANVGDRITKHTYLTKLRAEYKV